VEGRGGRVMGKKMGSGGLIKDGIEGYGGLRGLPVKNIRIRSVGDRDSGYATWVGSVGRILNVLEKTGFCNLFQSTNKYYLT